MKEYYEIATRNVEDDFHKRVEATYYSFEEAKSNINNYCSDDGYDHEPGTCWIYHILEEDNGEKTELECWSYINGECEVYADLRYKDTSIEEAIDLLTENGWLKEHDKRVHEEGFAKGVGSVILPKTMVSEKPIIKPMDGFEREPEVASNLVCPNCLKPIVNVWSNLEYKPNYCHFCGQKFDWSDVSDTKPKN